MREKQNMAKNALDHLPADHLDLSLRLSPVGLAQARQEACVPRVVEEARMKAMHTPAISISLVHARDGTGACQAGCPAECRDLARRATWAWYVDGAIASTLQIGRPHNRRGTHRRS